MTAEELPEYLRGDNQFNIPEALHMRMMEKGLYRRVKIPFAGELKHPAVLPPRYAVMYPRNHSEPNERLTQCGGF